MKENIYMSKDKNTNGQDKKTITPLSAINSINNYESLQKSLLGMNDVYNNSINELTQSIINSNPFNYNNLISSFSSLDLYNTNKVSKLEKTIVDKENKIKELVNDLKSKEYEHSELEQKVKELQETTSELQKSKELVFLTCKVHIKAADLLLEENNELLKNFMDNETKKSCVISIDIRRSTELMLKASSHDNYAKFISGLSEKLKSIVINNYGIFDKFTGDGILAYFPDFYSGKDSILKCILTAKECHSAFDEYYTANRDLFNIVVKTGLGIGIDYGDTKLVRINNEQTIVGIPVVYACRLSNAPYGHTFLNQKVFDILKNSKYEVKVKETEIDLKNEGIGIVYELCSVQDVKVDKPCWS